MSAKTFFFLLCRRGTTTIYYCDDEMMTAIPFADNHITWKIGGVMADGLSRSHVFDGSSGGLRFGNDFEVVG